VTKLRGPELLRATFVHLPGIGPTTEVDLWRRGIQDWADLRVAAETGTWPPRVRVALERGVEASERALNDGDPGWFARRLTPGDHWRLYPPFHGRTAFLDIETTSLSPYEGIVTVVTVHGAGATRTFVAGEDLEELPAYLRGFEILVTFNGSRFDVPFLEAAFPQLRVPAAHIDLRFLLYRLGLAGGLKRIEATVGLGDRTGVEGIDGLQAVRLWREWRRGNRGALDRLVNYNRADTKNLEPLLEFAVRELYDRLPLGRGSGPDGIAAPELAAGRKGPA
jgi:uncharacterized protein